MMKRVKEEPRGIHWTFTSCLEYIDFADDISLMSHTRIDYQDEGREWQDWTESIYRLFTSK
jgi:hypothetical protein